MVKGLPVWFRVTRHADTLHRIASPGQGERGTYKVPLRSEGATLAHIGVGPEREVRKGSKQEEATRTQKARTHSVYHNVL